MTVDLQTGRFHKVAEVVGVVLQVRGCEQAQVLHHAVRGHVIIEEPQQHILPLAALAMLNDVEDLFE